MQAREVMKKKEADEVERYIKKQVDDEARRDRETKERGERI